MAKGFPFVRQKDSMQCGIACLSMICAWYGRRYSIDTLSQHCFATKDGVSMLAIADAAEYLGLESQAVRLTVNALATVTEPCILHWNQNHFVVLRKAKRGRTFLIADPGKGLVKYTREEFVKHWCANGKDDGKGLAMIFEPTPKFGHVAEDRRRSMASEIRFLSKYVRPYRRYFIQILCGLLLASVLQLIVPFLTQGIVDFGIRNADIKLIWLILLGEIMIVAGRTATDFVRRWLMLHISMRINLSLVSDFFIKLLRLPMSFFDTKLMGDLLQRIGDHQRVQSFLTSQTIGVMFSCLSFVVFGVVLYVYNLLIFAVFVMASAVYAGWIVLFLRRRKVLDYEMFDKSARNNNCTYRFITSMQEIKLQDCAQRRRWEWEDVQADLFGVQLKVLKMNQTQEAGSIFINEAKNILITVLAATAVINGQMTLGAMLAVQYIIGQLNSPVEQLMGLLYSIQDVRISLDRINEIHHKEDECHVTAPHTGFAADKDISVDSITFRYDPHNPKPTLSDITVDIPAGKTTAIVGASGSGKTTLVKLLLGFYPVGSGEIRISGTPLAAYDVDWWRRQCGTVMQEGVIFSESIARNIATSDGDIDPERLEAAARTAEIHDFIMGLPLKYDTIIGPDGMGISQGQKQRMLIARAVYRNPSFIFMDEATNSLDAKTERSIVENLQEFYRGKTVVVVAHRLSTVCHADQIIVMDGGRVVETGTHAELTALRGVYYTLVKNQLELGS